MSQRFKLMPLEPDEKMAVAAIAANLRAPGAINGVEQWRAMAAAAPVIPPPTSKRLADMLSPIAESIAKNASVAPQLCFPHLYLGVKELIEQGFLIVPGEVPRG